MANTKLSAFFSLLLVFFSGVVVGVFGFRVYNNSLSTNTPPPQRKMDPEGLKKQLISEMSKECRLDDQQVLKLGEIYDQTRVRFDDLHKKYSTDGRSIWEDQIAEIKGILRPEQIPLYESLRARKEAEREADRKRRHKGGPGPGVKRDQ